MLAICERKGRAGVWHRTVAKLDDEIAEASALLDALRLGAEADTLTRNLPYGKQELLMELTAAGRAMGFSTQAVARQVRDAFEGAVAKRFARDEEVALLGRGLRLPAQHAHLRAALERDLEPLPD